MRQQLKDFFVPHEGNEYKPNSLEKAAVFGMVLLILLSFTLANLQSIIWMSSDWMVSTILPAVIVDLTNKEREDLSLGDLRRNATLDMAAQLKAQHMAAGQYFAHYSPDGISPWHWFSEANYRYIHAGENLAIHFTDSDEVVDAWMNSPTHRANIVNGNYTEIGVGTARGTYEGFNTVYVVQLFGTPAAQPAPVAVASTPAPTPTPQPATPQPAVLAETESIIEQDEDVVVAAEPVTPPLVAGSEEVTEIVDDTEVSLSSYRDPVVATSSDTATTSEEASTTIQYEAVEIAEITVSEEDESVILYSDLISTTTGGVPATVEPSGLDSAPQSTSPILAAATKPHLVLQIVYGFIALFVFISLTLSVFIEFRKQHPIQVAYSLGLVTVMLLLLYIHISVSAGALIV